MAHTLAQRVISPLTNFAHTAWEAELGGSSLMEVKCASRDQRMI